MNLFTRPRRFGKTLNISMWAVWVYGYGSEKAAFWKAFEEGDTEGIEQYLNRVLSNSISIFDTKARKEEKESSYHNLLVGILTGNADWLVKSNVEAGEGFADIIVETDDPVFGIVEYLLNDDRKDIQLYGIAFCKKRCRAICERL